MSIDRASSFPTDVKDLLLVEETRVPRNSDRMATRARDLRRKAESLWVHKLVKDPRGGLRTVEMASHLHNELQNRIDRMIANGEDNHTRLPTFARIFSTIAIFIDFFILWYFMSVVFNVDYGHLINIMTGVVTVFAILATGISYAVFTLCGTRLRDRKTNRNTLPMRGIDGLTWIMIVITLALVSAVAVLMFQRVRSEVFGSGESVQTALIYAWVFSIMVTCLAFVVVFVHAFDGSILTERADGLARVIRKPMKKRQAMLDQAQELDHLIAEQQDIAARQRS